MCETSEPTITTIIPTFRRPDQLRNAILSVLNQTYPHFQICVYDNASGDETFTVVSELAREDKRVKYHCHQENIGGFENFQYGLEHVATPFFSILCDDDVLLPQFYEIALSEFEKYPDAMFAATDVILYMKPLKMFRYSLENYVDGFYNPPRGLLEFYERGYLNWTGILFRSDVTKDVGLFDEEVGPLFDCDLLSRIAVRNGFVLTRRLGGIYLDIGKGLHYRWTKAGLKKMLVNLRIICDSDELFENIERSLVRECQGDNRRRCLYNLEVGDMQSALLFAQELIRSPGNSVIDDIFLAFLKWRWICSVLGYCCPMIRRVRRLILAIMHTKRQSGMWNQIDCLKGEIRNVIDRL